MKKNSYILSGICSCHNIILLNNIEFSKTIFLFLIIIWKFNIFNENTTAYSFDNSGFSLRVVCVKHILFHYHILV